MSFKPSGGRSTPSGPAECIERVHEYAELGVDEIACLMNFGNPDLEAVERSMGLFAERVAPLAG